MKLSTPHITQRDIDSIKKVLDSRWISTSAKTVDEFENKLSSLFNTKYSIALNSGTSAIHLGLKILGVNSKTEVIVPSSTFIAIVNPILYLGAQPIFFYVDKFHNLKIDDVINFIKKIHKKYLINFKDIKDIKILTFEF